MPNESRRDFLKSSAKVTAAASMVGLSAQRAKAAAGSNERLRIGFIGPGGRGFGAHVKKLCDLHGEGRKIELAGVAEVYEVQRNKVGDYIKEKTGTDPGRYVDYNEMFEKENLDAVCIGTPDHWHHKQTIDALNAGLNVYCEKPMTKTVEEAFNVEKVLEGNRQGHAGGRSIDQPECVGRSSRELLQRRQAWKGPGIPDRVLPKQRPGPMAVLQA